MGANLEKEEEGENLEEADEDQQENEVGGEEKVLDNNISPPAGVHPEKSAEGQHSVMEADMGSNTVEEVEEVKLEEEVKERVVDDEVLGADWGLVINQGGASENPLGRENPDDDAVVPCEEPMEVVENETVPDISENEKKEENVAQDNEL